MHVDEFSFGSIQIDGAPYENDVVIDRGKVSKRKKKASKPFREQFGHTPLSNEENIPWKCRTLVVGTGARGSLPVMPEVERSEPYMEGFAYWKKPTGGMELVLVIGTRLGPDSIGAIKQLTPEHRTLLSLPNTIVIDVQPDAVTVRRADQAERIPAHTILWAAGVLASPLSGILAKATGAEFDVTGGLALH